MGELFQAEFFKNNRSKLLENFGGTAPIIITANGLMQSSADGSFAFVQDSNFWYLSGINEPDITLVMDKGREFLIVPERAHERKIFDGAPDISLLKSVSGVREVLPESVAWRRLRRRLKKVKHVATLPPNSIYMAQNGIYANPARRRLIRRVKHINPSLLLIDLSAQLNKMRAIKQPPEIAAISRCVDLTAKVFKRLARQSLERFKHEYEAEAFINYEFGRQHLKHAFEPIVAAGKNATQLHYTANNSFVHAKSLLLVDIGAKQGMYGADLTRTFSVNSKPSKRQKDIYGAVLEIHNLALSLLKPGMRLDECESKVRHFAGEKLRELGLIRLINDDQVRRFYPHSTSHFLGLDTHDPGDYKSELLPNMTLTVEPGIYIPKEALGIRIEDDVVITENGVRVLSAKLKRSL